MTLLKSSNLLLALYYEMLMLELCLLANVNPTTNDYPHQQLSKKSVDKKHLENVDSDALASKKIESRLNSEVSNNHLIKRLNGQLSQSHFEIDASNSKKSERNHYTEAKEKNKPVNYVSQANEKSHSTIEKSSRENKGLEKQLNYQSSKYNDPNLLFLYQSKCQRIYKGHECENLPIINSDRALINLKGNKDKSILLDNPLNDFSNGKVIKEKFNFKNNENRFNSKENIVDDIEYIPHLPDCNKRLERIPVLVISTLDGHISGINYQTGGVVWSHETSADGNPLLSSSMSKMEVSSRGEWVRLIPSLDGGIYRFDGTNVEPLPISADALLQSSFKFNEDTIFSGGKFNEILGLEPQTGEVIYVCTWDGCPHKQTSTESDQVLVIKRISQTVRAIDPKTGNERWHFTVGKHELNVATSDCESLRENEEDVKSALPSLHFVLPEGLVVATDEHKQILWQQKLSSPVVSAWSLINGNLDSINLFNGTSVPALFPGNFPEEPETQGASPGPHSQEHLPTLYVGIHKQQLYIQQNLLSGPGKSTLPHFIQPPHRGVFKDRKVLWRSYLSAPYFRLLLSPPDYDQPPLLDYESKKKAAVGNDLAIKHHFDALLDHGYYMFGDSDDHDYLENMEFWNSTEEMPLVDDDSPLIDKIYFYCFEVGPSFWWKLAAWAGIYGVLHWLLVRYLVSRLVGDLRDRVSESVRTLTIIILQNILAEHPQVLTIIQRIGLGVLPLPPPSLSPTESGTTPSFGNETQRQDSTFSSRYSSDFEPMQCLGKGGFGVVFQVKNKLDQNEYAIKRILLPSKESSAERVKREVRALAKLNHTNIVRYYNSWMETPPEGWEQEADSWWKNSDVFSQSVLTAADVEESEHILSVDIDPPPKVKESLSGIVNRLSHNMLDVDVSEDSDSSDVEDGGVYINNYQADSKMDDSFEVCFEDSAGQELDGSDERWRNDPIVARGLNCEPSHVVSNEVLTGSDFSRLTCQTYSSLSKAPQTSNSKCRLRESRVKSSSFSSSSQKGAKLSLRRRAKSHSSCQDNHHKRPDSLNLITSSQGNVSLDRNTNRGENLGRMNARTTIPKTYLYIQMELCLKESLKDWLLANQTRDTQRLYSMFNDIVHAVEYVHDRSLMHRDLKPSNIFFSLDGEIKIGDFGLVTTIDEHDPLTPVDDQLESPISSVQQRTVNAGTHLYMSPEQMCGHSYTYKVDIFSLGLIFFEMLVPFSTEMERRKVMLKAREMTFPPEFSTNYLDVAKLLALCLHGNPNERPTTRGIRVREPLVSFQKDLDTIGDEEHFRLTRTKGHTRSSSGSLSSSFSSSSLAF